MSNTSVTANGAPRFKVGDHVYARMYEIEGVITSISLRFKAGSVPEYSYRVEHRVGFFGAHKQKWVDEDYIGTIVAE